MIETILWAIAPSLIVGIVLFYWERRQSRQDAKRASRDAFREESDLVRLDLEVATAQLSYATAMAVKRGHANGEMETAIEKYDEAMAQFREFERKQMVRKGK